jgi:hypothetical protein
VEQKQAVLLDDLVDEKDAVMVKRQVRLQLDRDHDLKEELVDINVEEVVVLLAHLLQGHKQFVLCFFSLFLQSKFHRVLSELITTLS